MDHHHGVWTEDARQIGERIGIDWGRSAFDVAQFRMHQLAEVTGANLLVIGSSRRGLLGRVLIGHDTRARSTAPRAQLRSHPPGIAASRR